MSGALDVFRHEFRRIFTVKSAFAVMVLGAAFYALFYPQPYLNEALRESQRVPRPSVIRLKSLWTARSWRCDA